MGTAAFGVALAALGLMLSCARAQAQFALDWSAIDGGGGTSTGGVYSVSGTVGQPEAGRMSGGPFTLEGGFWPGVIVPSAGEAPSLFIQASSDSVTLSWSPATPGFELEAAADLTGAAWSPAPAGNPVTIPISGSARFYRLRKP
jgi:hypothetical protein